MNQLSWLLYLADVLDSLGVVCAISAIFLAICCAVLFTAKFTYSDGDTAEEDRAMRKVFGRYAWLALFALFVVGVLSILVPSKNTMYAIAASQMGEQVLKTPVANKAEKALESWLDKQIADNKSSEKKDEDK